MPSLLRALAAIVAAVSAGMPLLVPRRGRTMYGTDPELSLGTTAAAVGAGAGAATALAAGAPTVVAGLGAAEDDDDDEEPEEEGLGAAAEDDDDAVDEDAVDEDDFDEGAAAAAAGTSSSSNPKSIVRSAVPQKIRITAQKGRGRAKGDLRRGCHNGWGSRRLDGPPILVVLIDKSSGSSATDAERDHV